MDKNTFSVLMSIYSKENPAFFDLSLNSILCEQTIIPNEFVLVCDGPLNEELEKVIEKYLILYPDILKIYRLEENGGLGEALQYGLTKCSNELVARADSDDICVNNRFEIQLKYFEEHPETDILGGNINEFQNSINERKKHIKKMPTTCKKIYKFAKYRSPLNHPTVMFKKSVVLAVGSYIKLPLMEDYYLWMRLICNNRVLNNINQILVHTRVGNGRIERRSAVSLENYKFVLNYMYEQKFINKFEKKLNILIRTSFSRSPKWAKKVFYYITRKTRKLK